MSPMTVILSGRLLQTCNTASSCWDLEVYFWYEGESGFLYNPVVRPQNLNSSTSDKLDIRY